MEPDRVAEIAAEEKIKDRSRYIPTGKMVSRQVIGISIVPVVTEYRAAEFYDKKKGRNVHAPFPCGVKDDVNDDESMTVGMINGLCREFSSKSKQEQDELLVALLDAPVMHVDGTVARVRQHRE